MAKQVSAARIKTETPRGVVLSADMSEATSLTASGAYEARQFVGTIGLIWHQNRTEWVRTNALNLTIRFFINAAAFSYWLAHPEAATHAIGSVGIPANFTLEPGHATAAMFGLSGDSLVDWAAAKIPFLQKEIPVLKTD